jgi:hypothetical protein
MNAAWVRTAVRAALLAAAVLVVPSCALHIGHVRTLRDAQSHFTELAAAENQKNLSAIFPTGSAEAHGTTSQTAENSFGLPVDLPMIQEFARRYREIDEEVDALTKRAASDLKEDRLLGTCLTLRVLARWRAGFYEHLLRAHELQKVEDGPGTDKLPPSLSNVAALAEATWKKLDEEKIEVFPRDRFLLKAMRGLVRYDIALIRTLLDVSQHGPVAKTTDEWKNLAKLRAEEMARAEMELAAAAHKEPLQIQRYVFLSRVVMLRSAQILAATMYGEDVRWQRCPTLGEQIKKLHADYSAADAEGLRTSIKVKPADLQKIIVPPPQS